MLWKQCHRLQLPVNVLMIDVDYFKKYNDSLGHLEGDKTLVAIAQCMKDQKIPHPASEHSKYVTVSIGMASAIPDDHNSHTQLLDEADKALYMAKKSGRNRVAMN